MTTPVSKKMVWGMLVLIVLVGAWARMTGQSTMALRADSIEFWKICGHPQATGGMIFNQWLDVMGLSGQFPFAMSFTKWFMDAFSMPMTLFNLRLPSMLWGLLAILFAYGLGRRFGGVRLGFLLAGLLALNAFHIQTTREAYYYPPMAAGAFLGMWGAVWAVQRWRKAGEESLWSRTAYVLVNLGGFALLIYSQPTGLFTALLYALVVAFSELMIMIRNRRIGVVPVILGVGYLALGIPLLTLPWGLSQLRKISSGEIKAASLKAFAVSQERMGSLLFRSATIFAWGHTPVRVLVTALAGLSGVWWLGVRIKKNADYVLIPYMMVGVFLSFLYARSQAGAMFEPRYLIGLLPAYLLLLALGLLALSEWAGKLVPERWKKGSQWVIPLAALGLLVYPAWLCTRMTGQPTPYIEIQQWVDQHLPARNPVLVDRWFEPWNELVSHPSTNVIYTFTVPNEPVETFMQVRWRDTAERFLRQNPDAAYLEIAKTYWDVATVGPWKWPGEFFARTHVFQNTAGLKLRDLGLASRTEFYAANSNRLVVPLFYNEWPDLIERAQKQSVPLVFTFGEGWSYAKLWRQVQGDFRDWRVLENHATIRVFNTTAQDIKADVRVRAMAANGMKRIVVNQDKSVDFQAGRLMEADLGPVILRPGENAIRLDDPVRGNRNVALLVESLEIRPAQ